MRYTDSKSTRNKAAKKKDPAERKREAEERRARLKAQKEANAKGGDAAVDEAADAMEKLAVDDAEKGA